MTWEYISGFLDADGSVMMTKRHINENKTAVVAFHNNEIVILKKIQKFIKEELGFNGSISKKTARKENHQDSYDLKYCYKNAVKILKKLKPLHPKKKHRKNIILRIQKQKPRNGKYKQSQLDRIEYLMLQYK